MPRLDHQAHQKGRQRRKGPGKQGRQHEFQRAAVHHGAHEHGHPHRQAQRLCIDAIAHAQHEIARQHRNGLGCRRPQSLPDRTLRFCQRSFHCMLHCVSLKFTVGFRHVSGTNPSVLSEEWSYYNRFRRVCKSGPGIVFVKTTGILFWICAIFKESKAFCPIAFTF